MGNMGSSVFYYSAIPNFGCSARNVTWQYLHHSGHLPAPYNTCPRISAILDFNRCQFGECTPRFWPYDIEFRHYTHEDWEGLGDPYLTRPANRSDGYGQRSGWVNVVVEHGDAMNAMEGNIAGNGTRDGSRMRTMDEWKALMSTNFYAPTPDPRYRSVLGSRHDHDKMRAKMKLDVEWLQPIS